MSEEIRSTMDGDVDLIASVISDGRCSRRAVLRATRLLNGYGSASVLVSTPESIGGPVGTCLLPSERRRLKAARDLAVRLASDGSAIQGCVSTPREVAAFAARLAHCREEVLMVLGLDSQNHVVGSWEVSRGWEGGINVHPRQIFSILVRESLGRAVVVHNHPSGSLKPSQEDLDFTATMIRAGHLLGIEILDHVIVARGGFCSIRQECRHLEFGPQSG